MRYAAALAVVAMVLVQLALPGRDVYHAGWYNVLLLACAAIAIVRVPRAFAVAACGVAIVAIAGVANGLLAPDNQRIVGAPGERVRSADLGGALAFPLVSADDAQASSVTLERPGRAPVAVGDGPRYAGAFVLRTVPRSVVYVEARDARGGGLTITQPTGSAFLSPVLLMQQHQSIAGMDLPFDSFAVPAAHRIVKAVLFSPQQAAAMRGMAGADIPAVLFAVDDEQDRPLPHGIALDPDGASVTLAGLQLHAVVLAYPAVDVEAVPQLVATLAGTLLAVAGTAGELWWNRKQRRERVTA